VNSSPVPCSEVLGFNVSFKTGYPDRFFMVSHILLRQMCHSDFLPCPSPFIVHITMAFDTAYILYEKIVVKLTRNEILNISNRFLWSPLEETVNMQLFNNPFVVKELKHLLQYHTNCTVVVT
jgi:hypothetical protein